MDRESLAKLKEADIPTCNTDALIDLRDIKIDKQKPIEERAEDFIKQVYNPYLFRVDSTVVKVEFGDGKAFSEMLTDVIRAG